MDTSKEYIKMCAESKEIQDYGRDNFEKLRPLLVYDLTLERISIAFWVPKKMRKRLKIKGDEFIVSIESDKDKNTFIEEGIQGGMYWLPRQDQLQDMLKANNAFCLATDFVKWVEMDTNEDPASPLFKMRWSMEQLWLAFVMSKKHNKRWTGKVWK